MLLSMCVHALTRHDKTWFDACHANQSRAILQSVGRPQGQEKYTQVVLRDCEAPALGPALGHGALPRQTSHRHPPPAFASCYGPLGKGLCRMSTLRRHACLTLDQLLQLLPPSPMVNQPAPGFNSCYDILCACGGRLLCRHAMPASTLTSCSSRYHLHQSAFPRLHQLLPRPPLERPPPNPEREPKAPDWAIAALTAGSRCWKLLQVLGLSSRPEGSEDTDARNTQFVLYTQRKAIP